MLEVEDTNVESVDQIENELIELGQQIGIDINMRFNEDKEFEDYDNREKVIQKFMPMPLLQKK